MITIAYTYEADYHCPACATKRFGTAHGKVIGTDDEGNEVHPVFDTDEWYASDLYSDLYEGSESATLACGTCGEVIDTVELR